MNISIPEKTFMSSERAFFVTEEGSVITLIQVLDEVVLVVEFSDGDVLDTVSFLPGTFSELVTRMNLVRLSSKTSHLISYIERLKDQLMRYTIASFVRTLRRR